MQNPYLPPGKPIPLTPVSNRWRRVVAWAVMIFIVLNLVYFISGLTMGHWEIYGSTIEQAVANSRLVRRIAGGVVGALLYWRFAAGVTEKRVAYGVAVYVVVQLIDVSVSLFAFRAAVGDLLDPGAIARSALAASVGIGIAAVAARRDVRPIEPME